MTWTNIVKNAASFSNVVKSTTSWIIANYLLKEDGGYLLKEDGGKIVLFGSNKHLTDWTPDTKHG